MRIVNGFILGSCLGLIASCASMPTPSEVYQKKSADQIFHTAETYMAKAEYTNASQAFEALDSLYPFNQYAEKAQLDMIKAYYQTEEYALSSAAAERYTHLYPRGVYTDHAYYLKGLAELEQDRVWFLRYFPKGLPDREMSNAHQAEQTFSELVQLFPNSPYAADAKQRIAYLRNLYAQAELNVAYFYMKKQAYVAAANRATYIVQHYPSTPMVSEALVILVKANNAMGLTAAASEAEHKSQSILDKKTPKRSVAS